MNSESDMFDMSVSSIFEDKKTGNRYAFVIFKDNGRTAEGKIPECSIISSEGFSDEDLEKLKKYMKNNLPKLKEMAASVDVLKAFMK